MTGGSFYAVFDGTTNNLLGECDTLQEAEALIEEVRPFGRFGPDGHDLFVMECDARTGRPK